MNYAVQESLDDEHDSVNSLARCFRELDARGSDRSIGLRSMRSMVREYYEGEYARNWLAAIDDELLRLAQAAQKRADRNARRRQAYRARRAQQQQQEAA